MSLRSPMLYGILIVYGVLAVLFAVRTPPWQAPDEPAHYNYIRQITEGQLLPVIAVGDWDSTLLETLKAERFAPDQLAVLPQIEYEDHQPPLYYWLSAPVYALSGGSLVALRLVSALWGGITLVLAFQIASLLYPQRPYVALATTALMAFLPQHLMIVTSVNNDALAGTVLAALLYACLRYRIMRDVSAWVLGGLLGVVLLTKTTIYFMAAVVLLTVILRWLALRQYLMSEAIMGQPQDTSRDGVGGYIRDTWPTVARELARVAAPAAVIALLWFGRNVLVYGFPDIMGLRAHDAVVIGQPRTADLIAQVGLAEYAGRLLTTTFQSFWGQFGWMGVPMNNVFAPGESLPYVFVGIVLLLAGSGLVLGWRSPSSEAGRWERRDAHRILLSVLALSMLVFLYYNTQFVQFQGRYLFTALIPFALYVALGLDTLFTRLGAARLVLALLFVFAALDVWLIWRVLPGALG